jgi:GTP-binding protein Era
MIKSGFVAIVGKSNVGKSTLLNKFIGQKISIVTSKKQTTRNAIQGIYNDDECQIVFIDTPGIHKAKSELGEMMDKASYSSIRDCDLALFVVDSSHEVDEGDQYLFDHLKFDCPVIVVFNKIDETNIDLITKLKEQYIEKYHPIAFIETVATEGFNVNELLELIKKNLEEGPRYYDVETVTDATISFRVQEIIREKMLVLLKDEVPHSSAVICQNIDYDEVPCQIYVKVIVEKESQKGIVIGSKGKMIKKIGTRARHDIEYMLGRHVNLDITVQVVENWRNSSSFLVKKWY